MQPDFGRVIAHPGRACCLAPRLFLGGSRHAAPSAIDLCQPRMRSQEAQDAPRDLSGADGRPDPLGAPGGKHCAGVSEGRRQGATAASAVGDAARALRPAVLQPKRPGDGGPACEAESVRRFAGAVLEKVPDETTILDFRHRLESHGLAHQLFGRSGITWPSGGGVLKKGGIVDATIISAPSSTGNESNARDPEMHQTKKGNRWHFGMKLHIGTDPRGLVHHLEGTAASVAT